MRVQRQANRMIEDRITGACNPVIVPPNLPRRHDDAKNHEEVFPQLAQTQPKALPFFGSSRLGGKSCIGGLLPSACCFRIGIEVPLALCYITLALGQRTKEAAGRFITANR